MNDDWITTQDAAALSGYHLEYIRQLLKAEKVKGRKWGQAWQVSRESLLAYMDAAAKMGDGRWGAKLDKPT